MTPFAAPSCQARRSRMRPAQCAAWPVPPWRHERQTRCCADWRSCPATWQRACSNRLHREFPPDMPLPTLPLGTQLKDLNEVRQLLFRQRLVEEFMLHAILQDDVDSRNFVALLAGQAAALRCHFALLGAPGTIKDQCSGCGKLVA